ncbi:MAG TPA: septum site-determining protein MinC [Clostridiaceae bacterium]|nr:septum site-determining protein MinC [Clostridiaceae bacterium]
MGESNITFKATVNGLLLIMKEEDEFTSVLEQLERKLDSAGKFFKGASINVRYRGKKLSPEEEKIIYNLMLEKTCAEINSFEEDPEQNTDLQENTNETFQLGSSIRTIYFKGIDEGITKFHRGTVRSGQLIAFEGNVVIIGDVNPGGEVVATGNVVVMGSLRGSVHAGADGNKDAIVVSLNLQPSLLRIADVITRPPDESHNITSYVPEIAYIKDNLIYIDTFLPGIKP